MRRSTNSFYSHRLMLVFAFFLACCFSHLRVLAQQDSSIVYGCTDPLANNYNSWANTSDGSCEYDIVVETQGCTDPAAINYDPLAIHDNGSCYYDFDSSYYGCTDTMALNWNPAAVYEDGSCEYEIVFETQGCTDPAAINYDPTAIHDNGSCYYDFDSSYYGCTDPEAVNFNSWANTDNGSCVYPVEVFGCTNEYASNFNPWATDDDGSCEYRDTIVENYDDCSFDYNATIDEAYISSCQTLGDSLAIVEWVVVQGQTTTYFEVYYFDFWSGVSVCYLYVSCDSTSNWQAKAEQGANSFTVSDEVNFSVVSSNNEMLEGAEIGLFPQPATDRITLILPETYSGNGEVTIRNVAGTTVSESEVDLNAFGKEIDLSGFVTGMYFIQVTQSGRVIATDQFIKE